MESHVKNSLYLEESCVIITKGFSESIAPASPVRSQLTRSASTLGLHIGKGNRKDEHIG